MLSKKILLKIGPRGQVTIPIAVRRQWASNVIVLEVNEAGNAMLSPVQEVAGELKNYQQVVSQPFDQVRQSSWENSTQNAKRG